MAATPVPHEANMQALPGDICLPGDIITVPSRQTPIFVNRNNAIE